MYSERLTILLSREEKRCLANIARKRNISMEELVRSAIVASTGFENDSEPVRLTDREAETLEQAAETALKTLQRAGDALDRAAAELLTTRAQFSAKKRSTTAPDRLLQSLLDNALAKARDVAV